MGYGLVDAKAAVLKALDLSLSGQDIICPYDNPHRYSISNLPSNAVVTWTCSGGISLSGSNTGSSCSVNAATPGYGHIQATVNINGTTTVLSKNIEVSSTSGNPYISYTTERDYLHLTVHTPNIYGIREFIWNASPIGSGGSSQSSHTGPGGYYWTIPYGSYQIECRIVTQCVHLVATATVGGYRSAVYPNPVDQTLYINIAEPESNALNAASVGQQQSVLGSYELRLFNIQGMLVRSLRVSDKQTSMDVSGLPDGNYFLHIYHDGLKDPEIHKIVISH